MPLVVAIIGYWGVGLPIAYIAGFVLHFGGTGLWVGLAAGLSFVAIVLTIRFSLRDRLGLIGDLTT
jgi:MATE family multidrug resistance protein